MDISSTILGWGSKGKKSGRMINSTNLGILCVCFLAAWLKLLCSAKLTVLTMMSQSFCVPKRSFLLFRFYVQYFVTDMKILTHKLDIISVMEYTGYRVSQQLSIQETNLSSEPPLEDSHQTLSWNNSKNDHGDHLKEYPPNRKEHVSNNGSILCEPGWGICKRYSSCWITLSTLQYPTSPSALSSLSMLIFLQRKNLQMFLKHLKPMPKSGFVYLPSFPPDIQG